AESPAVAGLSQTAFQVVASVVLADDATPSGAIGRSAEAAPARPEDERKQRPDRTDGQKNPADRVDLDAADRRVDRPDQHGPGGDEQKTDSHTHCVLLLSVFRLRQA